MTDNEIYTVVLSIITRVTGLAGDHVIPADDNEQSPSGAYASIKVGTNRGQRGQANITLKNTDLVTSPIGQVRDVEHIVKAQLTVSVGINFYRTGALENASNLFQANKLPSVSAELFAANLGWNSMSPINNLSALQSRDVEERAQMTLILMYERSVSETTNAIYNVPVSVENANGDTLESITIDAETGV
jgi:hypothetical protein